jgi:flagellar FliL protein
MAKEPEKEKAGEEQEGGGSKTKLFIIIGVVVLLLIGGGVAAFLMMGGEEEEAGEEAAKEEVVAVEEESVATYLPVPGAKEPGFVIVLGEGSRFRQAQVSLMLFTHSPMLGEYLKKNDPMVRHHIVNYLGTEDVNNFTDRAGREKIQQGLKDKLIEAIKASPVEADKLLADKLEAVYFTQFVLQ